MDYLDFDLEISDTTGREYPVAVLRSPAGEARATMRFPYDELALENRLLTLQNALLRSGGRRRSVLSPEQQAVRDFGQALFDALFTGEVRSRYDVSLERAQQAGKGLRLRLRFQSPTLAALPWEFLYDSREAEYVCLTVNTPLVRYLELPRPPKALAVALPLRILGVVCSPQDLPTLDVDNEKHRVEEALKDLRERGLVELHWLPTTTWRAVQREMRGGPWHVFHFVGHGGFDAGADEGLVYLADEDGKASPLRAGELGRLLADHPHLRLAVLNSCEGARGGARDIFSSTASILVRRGISAVVAMQHEITDRAAVELSRSFYEALADNLPVDAAVAEARKAVSFAVANTVEWGTPVLYTRSPDGILFRLEAGPPAEAAVRAVEQKAAAQEDQSPARSVVTQPPTVRTVEQTAAEREQPPVPSAAEVRAVEQTAAAQEGQRPAPSSAAEVRTVEKRAAAQGEQPPVPSAAAVRAVEQRAAAQEGQRPAQPVLSQPSTAHPVEPQKDLLVVATPVRLDMIHIPADEFLMGVQKQRVHVAEFYISKYPVTNAQYAAFVQATDYDRPKPWKDGRLPARKEDHPVVNVSWRDGAAFCDWLSKATGRKFRLPTEAEWEKAARGGLRIPDHGRALRDNPLPDRQYPWGDEFDSGKCNTRESGIRDTTPVGKYSPQGDSPYGVTDLAGNVWEWCNSLYRDYPYDAQDGREDLAALGHRVLRGGSWYFDAINAAAPYRYDNGPGSRDIYSGFRVVVVG